MMWAKRCGFCVMVVGMLGVWGCAPPAYGRPMVGSRPGAVEQFGAGVLFGGARLPARKKGETEPPVSMQGTSRECETCPAEWEFQGGGAQLHYLRRWGGLREDVVDSENPDGVPLLPRPRRPVLASGQAQMDTDCRVVTRSASIKVQDGQWVTSCDEDRCWGVFEVEVDVFAGLDAQGFVPVLRYSPDKGATWYETTETEEEKSSQPGYVRYRATIDHDSLDIDQPLEDQSLRFEVFLRTPEGGVLSDGHLHHHPPYAARPYTLSQDNQFYLTFDEPEGVCPGFVEDASEPVDEASSYAAAAFFDMGAVGFVSTVSSGGFGVVMRAGVECERWLLGAEVEGGFSWGGVSLPFAIEAAEGIWVYAAPGFLGPAFRRDAFVRIPLGMVFRTTDWLDVSAEVTTHLLVDNDAVEEAVLVFGHAAALFYF